MSIMFGTDTFLAGYARAARDILVTHMDELHALAKGLLEFETTTS